MKGGYTQTLIDSLSHYMKYKLEKGKMELFNLKLNSIEEGIRLVSSMFFLFFFFHSILIPHPHENLPHTTSPLDHTLAGLGYL